MLGALLRSSSVRFFRIEEFLFAFIGAEIIISALERDFNGIFLREIGVAGFVFDHHSG
jgi:hypothetical protein